MKERDEERDRLRKELRRSRERLHAIDADAQRKDREQYQFSTSTTQTPTDLGDHISTDATEDINKEVRNVVFNKIKHNILLLSSFSQNI